MTNKIGAPWALAFLLLTILLVACRDGHTEKNIQLKETEKNQISGVEKILPTDQDFSISQLSEAYDSGSTTIEKTVLFYLNQIEKLDKNGPKLNSIIAINPDAIDIAKALDQELREGKKRGRLHGIPVLLKDNIDTHDKMPTTAGSKVLANSFPLHDSWVSKKLRDAGAVILGKTNLSEWANYRGYPSVSGWSAVGGQTRNPYNLEYTPCGSSSGSGVAIAANLAVLAFGTETDGSIVCPSAVNGIVGIKPTVGLISRAGIIPISHTFDTPGPMARSVADAAVSLNYLIGVDPADSATHRTSKTSNQLSSIDYTEFLNKDGLAGKRIGFYLGSVGYEPEVDRVMNEQLEVFKSLGAEIIEISRIVDNNVWKSAVTIMDYELKAGLKQYFGQLGEAAPVKSLEDVITFNENDPDELKYFGQESFLRAAKVGGLEDKIYLEALDLIHKTYRKNGIDKVMKEHQLDAILAPTSSAAWKIDYKNGDNFTLSNSWLAARAGYPAITVPMGYIEGLPVGLTIFGKAWSEPTLIEIAFAYEQSTKHRKQPDLKSLAAQ